MNVQVWLAAIGLVLAGHAAAAASPDLAAVRARIEKAYPNIAITAINPSEQVPGWLEVSTEERLVYASADGGTLFVGNVIDITTKTDLTSKRWVALNRIDYNALPFNLAVTSKRGDGSRKLVVFADPQCPYCQQLEKQLASLDNVTIYTYLFPLESIHPGSTALAKKIWCAEDRSKAWSDWMLSRASDKTEPTCDIQGLTTITNLGKQLKVNATPTLFFNDGHRVDGVLSNQELEREFIAAAVPKSSGKKKAT